MNFYSLSSNMESIKVFLLIFFFFTVTIASKEENCLPSKCSGSPEVTVEFPFSLEGNQQDRCRYPGVNISCDQTNSTVLQLGTSGKFSVRQIDYIWQEVEIYDQDNCLPKRLLKLDLTGSPFKSTSYYSLDVVFFNCSSQVSTDNFQVIDCLSIPNYTVVAAYGFMPLPPIRECERLGSVNLPGQEYFEEQDSGFLTDHVRLLWDTPSCGDCVAEGGNCRFKEGKGNRIGCFNSPGLLKEMSITLILAFGTPCVICGFLLGCYIFRRFKKYNASNHQQRQVEASSIVAPQPFNSVVGLDESVIQSYPKTVLGESRRFAKPDDNICAICLSEYKPKEILKTITECEHCFHAACIDEWLRRNVTCPLCRKSPKPSPPPT